MNITANSKNVINISIGVKYFCFANEYVLHTPLSHTDDDTHS